MCCFNAFTFLMYCAFVTVGFIIIFFCDTKGSKLEILVVLFFLKTSIIILLGNCKGLFVFDLNFSNLFL